MTFNQIYTEVAGLRFNTGTTELARVKNWVNQAEIAVWGAADWNFKRQPVQTATPTLSGGKASVDLSGLAQAVGRVQAVYLAGDGTPLVKMDPNDFEATYSVGTLPSGTPEAYTITSDMGVNPRARALYIGPASTQQIAVASTRRYFHLNNAGAYVAGTMTADTDVPCWDAEFHYILVPLAIRLGKLLEDDPSASLDDQALLGLSEMGMFKAMKEELADTTTDDVFSVWSAGGGVAVWGG